MTPIITATNIHRAFGEGSLRAHILKGIDMTVGTGEFLGIMGKSGAGKSTLLYQLSALDEPTEGTIEVNGTDIISLHEHERTAFRLKTLGFIFQNYALVPDLTAEENVMLPLLMRGATWPDARAAAQAAIDEVGMAGKYPNLPSELSGGEQQRISIARAVAGKPKILFADEPTANLDSVSGTQVIELITRINRDFGQTVVMVTHEREYASGCDRILHMEDGQIVHEEHLTHREP
ncbi:MAG: ABC transporter ATP-binding protein [Patescibacteria group bacterium]